VYASQRANLKRQNCVTSCYNDLVIDENRAWLLTAAGTGAIAVVRMQGPGVSSFLARRFSGNVQRGRCVHGELRSHDGNVIDDPVVVPAGDGVADLNLHGGTYVVRAVLELCRFDGFAIHDRLDLPLDRGTVDGTDEIETEMLQHLPLARTELSLRVLLAQPTAWRSLVARISAGAAPKPELQRVLHDRSLHWLLSLPRVAIIGPANVGKSTLANQLFNQQRSITADMPGTTRDWVGEVANLNGLAVMLIDTPGRRAAGERVDPIEDAALAASEPIVADADLVIVVLDRSSPFRSAETDLRSGYPAAIVLANKSDHPPAWDAPAMGAISIVATTGAGVEELVSAVLDRFHCSDLEMDAARCWTDRQRKLIEAALSAAH
jgi:tRNA modification GTPase